MLNGCNYFGKGTIRSVPFAIFNRQDLLQLALDLKVPVPEIYGSILKDEDALSFSGSINDSKHGFQNYESIKVFKTWAGTQEYGLYGIQRNGMAYILGYPA